MPENPSPSGIKNHTLTRLARSDLALLKPDLVALDLPIYTQLETPHSRIDAVYFLEKGFASVVADSSGKRAIEVGITGREGMTGLPVVLGHDRSRHKTYIQVAAAGFCISAAKLRSAMTESASLHRTLLRCAHAFFVQTAETVIANGRSKDEERLARWLLMAHDRLDGREVPLSHKLLAVMLGVHRPAVTVALQALERKGLVRPSRKNITILNRKGLVAFSKGAYVPPDHL
jgi:CRP-like cAMP-binding protein